MQLTVFDKHELLKRILNLGEVSERLIGRQLHLSKFAIKIAYRAGFKGKEDDKLSRLEASGVDRTPLDRDNLVLAIVMVHKTNVQKCHIDFIRTIANLIRKGRIMEDSTAYIVYGSYYAGPSVIQKALLEGKTMLNENKMPIKMQ